jgi:ADP-ribosylglycohydrolase
MTPSTDPVLGCILGGAIGDCVAGVAERSRLCLSDDTHLTLATCEAICASGEVSPDQIATAFLRWFRSGRLTGIAGVHLGPSRLPGHLIALAAVLEVVPVAASFARLVVEREKAGCDQGAAQG